MGVRALACTDGGWGRGCEYVEPESHRLRACLCVCVCVFVAMCCVCPIDCGGHCPLHLHRGGRRVHLG